MIPLDALGWANVAVNGLLAFFAAISTALAWRAARSAAEQIRDQHDNEIERRARAVTVSWCETTTFNGQRGANLAPTTTYEVTIDNSGELPLNQVLLLCPPRTVGSMKNHKIGYLDDGRVALPLGNFPSRSQKVIDVDVETCETRSESRVNYEVMPVAFDLQFRDVDCLWWRTSMGCNACRLGEREGKLVDKWYLMVPKLTRPVEKGNVANLSKDGSAHVERF